VRDWADDVLQDWADIKVAERQAREIYPEIEPDSPSDAREMAAQADDGMSHALDTQTAARNREIARLARVTMSTLRRAELAALRPPNRRCAAAPRTRRSVRRRTTSRRGGARGDPDLSDLPDEPDLVRRLA